MSDKYDEAIAYLTANPNRIEQVWNHPIDFEEEGGCLFMPCTRGYALYNGPPQKCGCLTQIRSDPTLRVVGRDSQIAAILTKEIRQDQAIPKRGQDIKISDLQHFATWQRRLDALLG